ncbi:endo-1,4-beta-xylanase 5-like [Solanum lycopersicum]|uniref:GH10 domain-containing protein n=1 Tax=Solanum lycopersicum TaxID=4081 RepID=A0A3Q7GKY0_SOLLC|nr:uncharacterized protein LOC101260730 [Solanum lycopersicum]
MNTFKRDNVFCHILLISCFFLCAGFSVYAIDYDYHFTIKCLEEPLNPQYSGGIAKNPEINDGLNGWTSFGSSKIETRTSKQGNTFIVASNRTQPNHSFSQTIHVEKNTMYTISAWLQVSHGKADVVAMIRTPNGDIPTGWAIAKSGCWSMLKGGFNGNFSGPAELYFESKDISSIELWADSISIQPFTLLEWKAHQDQSIEKTRKSKVKLLVVDHEGQPIPNATIMMKQTSSSFPIGNAMSSHILTNTGYQDWYNPRFKLTVFENEMKWWLTEALPNKNDYHLADAMLQYVQNRSMLLRGHNIVWENRDMLPQWAKDLPRPLLATAIERRFNSLVPRYRDKVMHWDVDNENMHFSYLESQTGENTVYYYKKAYDMDKTALLFLNEWGTIENPNDIDANPAKYLAKIEEFRTLGYNGSLGIGLQGHFDTPVIPYIRSALDILATANLPIWITELDVSSRPLQADYLRDVLGELYTHPGVQGIVFWSPWQPQGCFKMCLTDNDFNNLATGDVVDDFMRRINHQGLISNTNHDGYVETSLYHGDYEVIIKHSTIKHQSFAHKINVAKGKDSNTLMMKLSA